MVEEFAKNLDEEEREEADRNKATGFNNFDAADETYLRFQIHILEMMRTRNSIARYMMAEWSKATDSSRTFQKKYIAIKFYK